MEAGPITADGESAGEPHVEMRWAISPAAARNRISKAASHTTRPRRLVESTAGPSCWRCLIVGPGLRDCNRSPARRRLPESVGAVRAGGALDNRSAASSPLGGGAGKDDEEDPEQLDG